MKSLLIEPLEARIAPATLSIGTPTSILEGDSGTKTLTFTVTLDEAPANGETISVAYQTVDGTATAGSDYVAKNGTLTFEAGMTSQIIQVVINGDLDGEDDETFTVQLSDAANATIETGTATGTILNDPKLSISAPQSMVEGDEGVTEMIFTVSLTEGFTKPVSVNYQTTDGTATAGTDYVAQSGTLTFEAGETSKTIAVEVNGDLVEENHETLQVQLSNAVNASLATGGTTGTIYNDDAKLSIETSKSIVEGDSGQKMLSFTVTLSRALSTTATVEYETVDGTATAGSDYDAVTGTLTFAPGELSKTIQVPIKGDLEGEADETFQVKLSNPTNASFSADTGTGTILNDAKISISNPQPVTEGNSGQSQMVFTVKLTEGFDKPVTVDYGVTNGAAPNGATRGGSESDYEIASPTGELVFQPGETEKTVSVSVVGDTRKELDETVQMTLSSAENASITQANAVGTILDDDLYEFGTITVNDVIITEGDSGSSTLIFTITLGTAVPTGQQLVVGYKTVDGTATGSGTGKDFDAKTGTVIFNEGETVKTVAITVWGDRSYEGLLMGAEGSQYRAEQFTLEIEPEAELQQKTTNNPLRTVTFKEAGSKPTAVATLKDTDTFPSISISDAVVLEGDSPGERKAQFTVTLSEPVGFDTKVTYSLENGSATLGSDFLAPGELFVTIGKDQRTAVIEIPIVGDDVPELNETFGLKLESAVAQVGTGQTLAITQGQATGTIINDEVKVELEPVTSSTVLEGDSGTTQLTFRVKLVGNATQAVTVNFSTQDGTAISTGNFKDFEAVTQALVFQPGEMSKEVTILINGDLHKEGSENFKVVLTADNVELGGTAGRLEQVVTIEEETTDVVPTASLSYQTPNGGLVEGGKATFTVTLSAPSNVPIEIPYQLVDGTAKSGQNSGNDYVRGSNLKVVIPAGQTSATFTVDILDDALAENAETFTVKLTPPATGEEAPTPTYSVNDETDSVEVVISASDLDAPLPTLSISDVTVVEGDPTPDGEEPVKKYAIFTIKLSSVAGRDVTVTAATLNALTGTGLATAGEDYVATEETLTIAAGSQTATFKVEITGDDVIEGDERFFVRLSNPQFATLANEQAMGTIQNDDSQFQILFKQADGSYAESMITVDEEGANNTEKEVSFIIRRVGDITGTAEARYATVDGVDYMDGSTKIRGAVGSGPRPDFTPVTESYTFAAGQMDSPEFTIKIKPDGTYEGLEEFRVQLEGAVGNYGTVRITDNELRPTVSFVSTNVSVLEGDASSTARQQSTLVFQVKLSHVDETGLTLTYNTQDDDREGVVKATAGSGNTPAAKADYLSAVNGQLVFAPGELEKNISITVLGDNRDEYDESFKLVLSGAALGVDGQNQAVTLAAFGSVTDNDAEAVVSITDLVKPKSGSSTEYEFTTYAESDTTSANKFFLVTLTGETEKLVTVNYITRSSADANPDENVYAIADEDFVGVMDGVITFDPNNSTESARTLQQIKVGIINDTIVEGDQSFEVFLTEADGAAFNDRRGVAVIVEDTNDDPLLTINDITVVEGNDSFTPQNAKFTVTLATKAQRPVTINFATADGTGKATGIFADYISTSGQITFAPGETSQEINVQILNDTYKEADETFKVQLSGLQSGNTDVKFLAANGSTGTGAGTATIQNGDDTIVGVGIKDVKVVEGAGLKFEVETSIASAQSTSMKVALRNGTAVLGSDYKSVVQNPTGTVTIAANQTTGSYEEYGAVNDSTFEFSEHLFADLSGVPAGMEVVKGTARAEIYSDDVRQLNDRTVQWIDLDGDLVTLKVSKGSLDGTNFNWVMNGDNVYTSAVGGRALQTLNLYSREFQGANVTITAERQPGFTGDANGLLGDGRVNVGFIYAGAMAGDGINFFGIDLGKVKVDGDLGRIDVGDRTMSGLSLRKLEVFSLGVNPESTDSYFRNENGGITGVNTGSYIQGTVGSINVRTDFAGFLRVSGSIFGDINSLKIGGALRGLDNFNQTGTITFTGTLGKATIGEIYGGVGSLSGRIEGDVQHVGNINSIKVLGDISGNSGIGSGVIAASSIGKVKAGRVLGGSGDDSGQIRAGLLLNVNVQEDVIGYMGARSGAILTDSGFGAKTGVGAGVVKIGGRLIGGSGELSGIISSLGGFSGVTVGGKVAAGENVLFSDITAAVTGGEGANSGRIEAAGAIQKLNLGYKEKNSSAAERISLQGGLGVGSGVIDARGGIAKANLFGGIEGGEGADSGAFKAAVIRKAQITGDLRGGNASGSGIIAVDGAIGSLVLDGNIKGGSSKAATEDGAATVVNTTGAVLAGQINSMVIKGDVTAGRNFGAGLSGSASIAVNGIIGSLTIKGDLLGHDHTVGEGGAVIEEENVYAKILAFGDAKYAAIGKLKIGGDVALAEISAGVSIRAGTFGFPVNADAWINSVEIGGDVRGMNITAGANKGQDGIFGTGDDAVLSGHPLAQINDPNRFSGIAKVIIKGSVTAETEIGTTDPLPFGLIAQYVGSVKVGSQSVSLLQGAGNDKAPGKAIAGVDSFKVIELPIV